MSRKPVRTGKVELFLTADSPRCEAVKAALKALLEEAGLAYSDIVVERDISKEPEAMLELIPAGLSELPVLRVGSILMGAKSLLSQEFVAMTLRSFLMGDEPERESRVS